MTKSKNWEWQNWESTIINKYGVPNDCGSSKRRTASNVNCKGGYNLHLARKKGSEW